MTRIKLLWKSLEYAIFKSLGYACKYVFIKYKRFFDKLAGKDTTVIDWVLSVVDLAASGIKYEYSGKDENLRCIIGVCKTIEITLGYVYANDSDAESKRKQLVDFAKYVQEEEIK